MITVLQRQQVSKRPASPVHTRARSVGVRWNARELPGTARPPQTHAPSPLVQKLQSPERARPDRSRGKSRHSFLQGQLVKSRRRRAARRAEKESLWAAQKPVRSPARRPVADAAPATRRASGLARALGSAAFTRALRGPWLFIGVVVAGILLVALAGARLTGLPFPQFRPALPAPSDVDPAFYAIVMPEPSAPPGFSVSPALIATLKVSRYTTRAGDSLSRIAARFKLNVDTVVSWNGIRDARAISAGTVLDIPNSDGLKYVVRRGDTLQGIARAQGVDFNSVLDWNRLATSVITVGQELFLPGARLNSTELNRILGSLFMYPVQGRISSWFGERAEPFTGVPSFHNGIDIVNAPGTPILAAMAGEVADLGFNRSYGYYVILKHSGQYQTLYGHLTRSVVTRGQKVRQGEKIGELGTTGVSTGPHLHFSVFKNGQPVDPLRFLT